MEFDSLLCNLTVDRMNRWNAFTDRGALVAAIYCYYCSNTNDDNDKDSNVGRRIVIDSHFTYRAIVFVKLNNISSGSWWHLLLLPPLWRRQRYLIRIVSICMHYVVINSFRSLSRWLKRGRKFNAINSVLWEVVKRQPFHFCQGNHTNV